MKTLLHLFGLLLLIATVIACTGDPQSGSLEVDAAADEVQERGLNNGILLRDGDFVLELAIFETGVPPEYRAWAASGDRSLEPEAFDLEVRLTRIGNRVDEIDFRPQGDYLRGDTVIYEPHSFTVTIDAAYSGQTHRWEYDSFEGRTRISAEMATAFGIDVFGMKIGGAFGGN